MGGCGISGYFPLFVDKTHDKGNRGKEKMDAGLSGFSLFSHFVQSGILTHRTGLAIVMVGLPCLGEQPHRHMEE